MKIDNDVKLSFDDVFIRPKPTELSSRFEVNLNVAYICKHSRRQFYGFPVCVANMDTIGTINIAKILHTEKTWVALHKFIPIDDLIDFLKIKESEFSFISMGISNDEINRIYTINQKVPIKAICIDAANAYMYSFLDTVKRIRDRFIDSIIIAGNVCTPEGVENIIKSGADICKVGISNGSFCDTKNKAGIGQKQLSVAIECGQAANELNALCCSDGGCRTPADICKCLGAGSHIVMCGGIFSGALECEGEWKYKNDKKDRFKMYGMSSKIANDKYFGGLRNYRTSEGKEEWIDCKGPILDILQDIKGGLASCCTYTNTKNLENLYKNVTFTM